MYRACENWHDTYKLVEGYRSGHNEAVLKTVWVQAHGGSNPSPSAKISLNQNRFRLFCCSFLGIRIRSEQTLVCVFAIWRKNSPVDYFAGGSRVQSTSVGRQPFCRFATFPLIFRQKNAVVFATVFFCV